MKITVEELDIIISKKLSAITTLQVQEAIGLGKSCSDSKEFMSILESYVTIFAQHNKTIRDLIFNCLLTGITIGNSIAENSIEVNQLEIMCGMDKGEGE